MSLREQIERGEVCEICHEPMEPPSGEPFTCDACTENEFDEDDYLDEDDDELYDEMSDDNDEDDE